MQPEDDPLDHLRYRIAQLRIEQGEPSLRDIAKVRKVVSHTTVGVVLRCRELPKWDNLVTVVESLNGDPNEFKRLWLAARGSIDTKPLSIQEIAATSGLTREKRLGNPSQRSMPLVDLLQGTLDEMEQTGAKPASIAASTGHVDLDGLLGGIRAGQLVVIAGPPGVGKSILALDIIRATALRQETPALLLTFEARSNDIVRRLFAAEARIPLHVVRFAAMSDDEWTELARRLSDIADAPLFICDSGPAELAELTAEIRQAVSEDNVRLIVIDSIQHIIDTKGLPLKISDEISRTLKRLALELKVAIIVVSQMRRQQSNHESMTPTLGDFQTCGGLDEVADIVMLVHREDYYNTDSPRVGEVDIVVAKHRDGPKDTVTLAAQPHLSRFVDFAI